MIEVRSPNQPSNGDVRLYVNAWRQSTSPEIMGTNADKNASVAEPAAIGIASRAIHLTPQRLTKVKKHTIEMATASTGKLGKYQCWSAAAERRAVRPQVGIQPHQ